MSETLVFQKTPAMADRITHYCPGCQHGVGHRLVAECLDEMGLTEKTIAATSIGCSVFLYDYILVDAVESPHGRAPAVATGVKHARPDAFVFTYQGDGDLAAIGMAEIIHAANRGERISVIFVNNTVYGMTGGQMAPTTLVGQKATTCPNGRCAGSEGMPFHMAEMLAALPGVAFSARMALNTPKNILQAKKAMRRAFEVQVGDHGLGFIELLATCPTNWKMDPLKANERVSRELIPCYPLGVYKDVREGGAC